MIVALYKMIVKDKKTYEKEIKCLTKASLSFILSLKDRTKKTKEAVTMTQELKEDVKSIVSILVQLDEVGVSLMNNNANLLLARQNMSEEKESEAK